MIATKWDLISNEEREALQATPLGVDCSGCGTPLATEADFAQHFLVPDARYKNLGECPHTERGKALLATGRAPDFYRRVS